MDNNEEMLSSLDTGDIILCFYRNGKQIDTLPDYTGRHITINDHYVVSCFTVQPKNRYVIHTQFDKKSFLFIINATFVRVCFEREI
jgi:hypothetical protein